MNPVLTGRTRVSEADKDQTGLYEGLDTKVISGLINAMNLAASKLASYPSGHPFIVESFQKVEDILKGVFERAENTRTYKFEDGAKTTTPIMDLEVLASYCERAFADLQIHKAVLADAQNHVVECEGEVAKAELFLEECQAEFRQASKARAGVPCGD